MDEGMNEEECPGCGGRIVRLSHWEGRCGEPYDPVEDQYGCGWGFDHREDEVIARRENRP